MNPTPICEGRPDVSKVEIRGRERILSTLLRLLHLG